MKTLSIKQPWASMICAGIKDVENRTWKTKELPGRILIHASSAKVTKNFFNKVTEEQESYISNHIFYGNLSPLNELPTSAIIGYATVEEFVEGMTDSVWDDGADQIKWRMKDAWMFDEPILNVKGKLNLFDYDLDEDNLPPAHQVKLESVELNGIDELLVPCYEFPFNELGKEGRDCFKLYLTDDMLSKLCTDAEEPTLKHFKTISLVYGDKFKEFELADESGIYVEPDLDDETKPYLIMYHDGQEGAWLNVTFVLGKKTDEGEYYPICYDETISTPETKKNNIQFMVDKSTFQDIVSGKKKPIHFKP